MEDYKKLVNRLREEPKDSRKAVLSIYDICVDAACAIESLLDKLKYAEAERDAVTRHMIELEQEVCRLKSRLAAYEDTGLEPEEIKVHEAAKYNAGYYHGDEDRCRWIEKELGPIDHLRDLLRAEQEGRLVVLPCGTDVELVRDGYVFKADHWNHTLTAFRDEPKNKSGKQIALFSTKEAEAALAQEGGNHEADSV